MYAVLGFSLLADGASLVRAWRHTRREASERRQPYASYVRASRDPTTKTVLFEDSAAVIGVVLAFAGVMLFQLTGNQVYDGLASVAIGVLLAVVAFALGRDTKNLLIGRSATPDERQAITEVIEADAAVDRVLELLTMALSPDRLLVAARIDLADGLSADEIERASSAIDRELRERIPTVWQVFLDATPPRSEAAAAAGRQAASKRRLSGRLIACAARRRSRRRPARRRRCASPRGPRGPRAGPRRPGRARGRWPGRSRGPRRRAATAGGRCRALDDAAAELVAELERQVGAVAGVDAVRAPVAELRVEGARSLQVAGVQLEMHDGCGGSAHDLWLFDPHAPKFIGTR